MRLVVDASVGLKWLDEADSDLAEKLLKGSDKLLIPDFWLNEAIDALWVQVRRGLMTDATARAGFRILRSSVNPEPTAPMGLHASALDIALAVARLPLGLEEWASGREA